LDSVVIGVDPHKHSVTIEVVDDRERVLHKGRYSTDTDGYRQMLAMARRYPKRRWAVEGCNGIGRHVAQGLVSDGETVVDVPAKLAARARVFDTGNGRRTDSADAHSVAVVALRTRNLVEVRPDDDLVALRYWSTGETSWPAPARRRSTDCTGCCSSYSPVGPSGSCPQHRPRSCWTAWRPPMRPDGCATGSPPNCSPRSSCSTRR
jgi:hypothetical protein